MAIDFATLATVEPLKGFVVKGASGNMGVAPLSAEYVHYDDGTANGTDIQTFVSTLYNTVNTFLTGADNDDGTLNRLSELVAAIQANAGSIDALLSDKVAKTDIADNLATNDATKVLSAAQGVVLKTAVDAKVATADIVDDCTHTDADKPLSANQGKVLKDALDTLSDAVSATKLQAKVLTALPDTAAWPADMADNGIIFYVPASA